MSEPKPRRRGQYSEQAYVQYKAWVRSQAEYHSFLVCALCENGGVVTIMAGYAVCWMCAFALRETYAVQEMIRPAIQKARALDLPFGPTEWITSFEGDVRRKANREKAQKKKAFKAQEASHDPS